MSEIEKTSYFALKRNLFSELINKARNKEETIVNEYTKKETPLRIQKFLDRNANAKSQLQ